jgi:hypothetical protein
MRKSGPGPASAEVIVSVGGDDRHSICQGARTQPDVTSTALIPWHQVPRSCSCPLVLVQSLELFFDEVMNSCLEIKGFGREKERYGSWLESEQPAEDSRQLPSLVACGQALIWRSRRNGKTLYCIPPGCVSNRGNRCSQKPRRSELTRRLAIRYP